MNKNIGALILIGIILLIGYVIPITLVLGNEELTNAEYVFELNLFSTLLIIGTIGTTILYFARYLMKKDNEYGDSFGFFDIGESPSLPFFKRFTAPQLTLIFAIFLSILFLVITYQDFGQLTGLKVLPQQFTPIQSLVFSTALIPVAEEMMSMFIIGILVLGLVLLSIKFNLRKTDFLAIYYILIPIIMGILLIVWHMSAYKGSDVSLVVVFLFWTIKTFLVLVTGFFVIGWLLHAFNNFFIDFSRLTTSSDTVLYLIISLIFILVILYFILYRDRLFGSNKQPENIIQ